MGQSKPSATMQKPIAVLVVSPVDELDFVGPSQSPALIPAGTQHESGRGVALLCAADENVTIRADILCVNFNYKFMARWLRFSHAQRGDAYGQTQKSSRFTEVQR